MSDEPDYPAIVYHTAKTGLDAGYDKGFAAGVRAAREAVEPILSDPHGRIYKDTALAAIDKIGGQDAPQPSAGPEG